ncbi:LamB/YcsF family protein [Brachybacterium sp. AOP25-B2-12]|uniref:LamB/YcsF family protein n=1 Tax=Brachybacterium sp. AOP25-B2-12 TaxID=3457710 RepID=UPI00403459BE
MDAIDLNADLGEGYGDWTMGDDAAMCEVVTTANIACGGHAGDPATMRSALTAARDHGVAVTAHVSYPDLRGFGRRFVDMPAGPLRDEVIAQTGALMALARAVGTEVRGVKPHGALYGALAHHDGQAAAVVAALRDLGGELALVAAPGSLVATRAEDAGIRVVREGFADRAYLPDGTLVPRTRPGAVLTAPGAVLDQALLLADGRSPAGGDLAVDSICLHGDTPGAVALARAVRDGLVAHGLGLASAL